jgi:hypothetical protein
MVVFWIPNFFQNALKRLGNFNGPRPFGLVPIETPNDG